MDEGRGDCASGDGLLLSATQVLYLNFAARQLVLPHDRNESSLPRIRILEGFAEILASPDLEAAYHRQVPVSRYADYEADIESIKRGESNILFADVVTGIAAVPILLFGLVAVMILMALIKVPYVVEQTAQGVRQGWQVRMPEPFPLEGNTARELCSLQHCHYVFQRDLAVTRQHIREGMPCRGAVDAVLDLDVPDKRAERVPR